ncbi:Nucleic acid-binding, OB-fold [Artemisia annua]|uniref:Nucleic acid-binding, OB-fold n=1 Tax=Artemisia annua TaxID=35608 RepID=A0A2U1L0G6_ARTAN|nr:Nucleic acid-binding, OB-fold [Artemisia annua]
MVERCSRSIRKDKEQGVLLRPLLPEATYLRLKEFRTASNLRKKVGELTMVADLANACKLEVRSIIEIGCVKGQICHFWYILSAKFSNVSGADWFSVFSDDAEKIIGCSADELEMMKSQLTKASWVPKLP